MRATETKPLRAGSTAKRAAILTGARELFLRDGFERTSVDAIAAEAGVSKRTIYDYFGDKEALLLAVVEVAVEVLIDAISSAVDEELGRPIDDLAALERALIRFALRIADTALGSADYTTMRRLVSTEAAHLPSLQDHWLTSAPEDLVAERLADFDRRGLLRVPKPHVAADHFIALTLSLLQDDTPPLPAPSGERRDEIVREGVGAFLRAYRP